jgi:hypothetical protein
MLAMISMIALLSMIAEKKSKGRSQIEEVKSRPAGQRDLYFFNLTSAF